MKNLTELNCSGMSGIDQHGISEPRDLLILDATVKEKIVSVNHLSNITDLCCCGLSGIDQRGISGVF